MPRQRNTFLPASMTTVYTSPSGLTDLRTGLPYREGGLQVGITIDLTEDEAQAYGTGLHEGRYRFVKVDSGATAANILLGTVGLMASVARGVNIITSYDKGLAPGVRPIVWLAPLTAAQVLAGAYVFVQEQGWATVAGKVSGVTNASPAAGDVINSIATGTCDDLATPGVWAPTSIGLANGSQGSTADPTKALLPNHTVTANFGVLLNLPVIEG